MLKALQFYNDAKTEIGAGAKLAPYVRLFMLGACGITLVLGLISLILSNFTGIIVIIAAALIAAVEATYYVPALERYLDFFLENYLWRAIAYIILAVLTFFSWITFMGGVLIVVGALAYVYCALKGETPRVGEREVEGYEPTPDAPPNDAGASTSLFGSYQQV